MLEDLSQASAFFAYIFIVLIWVRLGDTNKLLKKILKELQKGEDEE